MEHPDVMEVAVCGVKDDTWGERVGAVIRLKDGTSVRRSLQYLLFPTILKFEN